MIDSGSHRPHRRRSRPRRAPGWCTGDDDAAAAARRARARARCCGARCCVTRGDDRLLRRRRPARLRLVLRHRARRPAADRPGRPAGQGDVRPAAGDRRRGWCRPAAAGSPSWLPARCSTCTGRELAGFVQPLGGEYAARRSLLERLPFPTGYGVELGAARRRAGAGRAGRAGAGRPRGPPPPPPGRRRRWAGWPRRSTARPSCGSPAGRRHLVRPAITQFDRGGEHGFVPRDLRRGRGGAPADAGTSRSTPSGPPPEPVRCGPSGRGGRLRHRVPG